MNILKLAMEQLNDIENDTVRERKAEETITGKRHLPPGSDRPKAIITGANSGIGRGTAFVLAEEGYDVLITYIDNEEEAIAVQKHIQEEIGSNCHVLYLDVSEADKLEKFMSEAVSLLGGLDLLVNNAAVNTYEACFETKTENIDQIYQVNFRGPIMLLQEAGNIMKANGTRGSVINISSIHATHAEETDAMYGSLKAALSRSTLSYALQYGPFGIRINSILPGAILIDKDDDDTHSIEDMQSIPLGRSGLPRDIAHAISFLASERASYITGVNLLVDGGMALKAYL